MRKSNKLILAIVGLVAGILLYYFSDGVVIVDSEWTSFLSGALIGVGGGFMIFYLFNVGRNKE
ncbi:hypothetical protein [Marinifilum fragile]|uniref:hypothetical protein n=1 Tax=Marinifilum fragile TaxID=570161 RepID=UPI002AA7F2F4|nr:hypothetical protein [Marinifilum fragile]